MVFTVQVIEAKTNNNLFRRQPNHTLVRGATYRCYEKNTLNFNERLLIFEQNYVPNCNNYINEQKHEFIIINNVLLDVNLQLNSYTDLNDPHIVYYKCYKHRDSAIFCCRFDFSKLNHLVIYVNDNALT